MNQDGKIGAFSEMTGRLMLDDVIDNGDESVFLKDNPDFKKYCPGFDSFTVCY